MVDKQAFRDAMARLAAAVHIITTAGPAGRAAFTASAVCSVTDSPPTLLVCVNRAGTYSDIYTTNQIFCVNTLAAGDQALSNAFAATGRDLDTCFATATWAPIATGAPALDSAAVVFDCRISQVTEVGTHLVLFGEVQAVRTGTGPALVYFNRAYHAVGA
jgi:flavin reductase